MEVINTVFDSNEHLLMGEQQSTVFPLGITNITFDNCQFINNYGSAIRAISMEEFRFVGQTMFRNNTGYRGGALYLYDSVIDLEENSTMIFENNLAKDIEAVLVGDMFGTGTGSVYAQFMYPDNKEVQCKASLKPSFQYSQRVDNYKICQRLNYAVYSYKSEEVLVLI